ncbi:MAG: glycosyltransferase family 4 protein [Kofleriaceae bacterium]
MNIGVITTSYPRGAGDAAGSFVAGHVDALRRLGHRVDVIAADSIAEGASAREPGVTRIASSLFYGGGAPDELERHPLRSLPAAASFFARLTAEVARRSSRWHSTIAHWLAPSALAALSARTPLLAIAHGGDVHTLRRMRLLEPALIALRARGAQLAFVSSELKQVAQRAVPRMARWLDDALVQPMGLDLARFTSIAAAPTTPPTVLIAARLVALKGVDVAIDAVDHLRDRARLVIAGDGPERAVLEARARGRASFLGAVDADHRDRLLSDASVVVVPSRVNHAGRTEGMPMIALEALAAGVPVVASAVGGLLELSPAVRLVPPDDPHSLASAIERVLAAPPARHELRSAVQHLDWSMVAPRLVRTR